MRKNNEPLTSAGLRRAVSYARVSDKEQERGYSIRAQGNLFPPYAAEKGLLIEQEFADVHSAKKPGRPGFTAMLEYLKKNPGCQIIVVEKTDRLYRNLADRVAVEALGVEVHLVKENQVVSKNSRAVDKHRHDSEVLNAKRYVDNLSEEVQKGLRTKAEQGLWPSYAPLGYRNTTGDDGRRIIVPDAMLGPVVTNLFAWFYTGEYSLQRLARRAFEDGFRFRKSSGRVRASTLQKILRNPIYMGEFDYGGVRYQGIHEPLVTREVWGRIQEILEGRNRKKHRKVTHEFVYSGMVDCGHCGCSLVGEIKKGRYVYYHCTGHRGKCGEPYTREEILERKFAQGLQELLFSPEILQWLEAELTESEKTAQAAHAEVLRRQQLELERLQQRQEMMYDDRLDGRIDAAAFDHRIAQIQVQREQIRHRIRTVQAAMPPAANQAVDLRHLTNHIGELFSEQTAAEQRKLLRAVVQHASWKKGELQISMRETFEALRLASPTAAPENSGLVDRRLPTGTLPNALEIRQPSRQVDSITLSESGTAAEAAWSTEDNSGRREA